MHSLKPYDKMMQKACSSIPCCPQRFFASPDVYELHSDASSQSSYQKRTPPSVYKQTPV